MKTTHEILVTAKNAVTKIRNYSTEQIDAALTAMADALVADTEAILEANAKDLEAARGRISDVMLDRLRLDEKRVRGMADGIMDVVSLPSPLGHELAHFERPNGMTVRKISCAMGVIAIIYESRPNVTSDAAALAIKSGSVCVLRPGRDAALSAAAIVAALRKGLSDAGLCEELVNLVEDTSRQSATDLMKANGYVDMLIPRGGAGLIRSCIENATVPCIQTGTGICHIYVDKSADFEKALAILDNAKTSRPSVCNACEVCLVHKDIAADFLPLLKQRLVDARAADGKIPVELRGDARACAIIDATPAGENDFDTEFLDYILAVGIVDSADEAISHIGAHSTGHSEAIIATDAAAIQAFVRGVDSSSVYVNVSTRFTDGGEFGFGCEMGISTQKLHARGPMGLCELTTYKYVITGDGQIR
ncbi:MAG: glutamate-5-semialdehyde dehydrogenase [Clostridia bacterium]|nr:glutamate-5-semialdehyde dehydrogenase [Clostridia bacterium]